MSKVILEISPETNTLFQKLKTTIEEMAGEAVTDDQVVDFMIRSMLSSVELPDEEHEGCGCCGLHEHHHHDHGYHEHAHHHCHCGDDCQCDEEKSCGCKHHH